MDSAGLRVSDSRASQVLLYPSHWLSYISVDDSPDVNVLLVTMTQSQGIAFEPASAYWRLQPPLEPRQRPVSFRSLARCPVPPLSRTPSPRTRSRYNKWILMMVACQHRCAGEKSQGQCQGALGQCRRVETAEGPAMCRHVIGYQSSRDGAIAIFALHP